MITGEKLRREGELQVLFECTPLTGRQLTAIGVFQRLFAGEFVFESGVDFAILVYEKS